MARRTRPRDIGREPLAPLRWNPPPTPRPQKITDDKDVPHTGHEAEIIVTADGRTLRRVRIEP